MCFVDGGMCLRLAFAAVGHGQKKDVFRHVEGGDGWCSVNVLRAWRKKEKRKQNEKWNLLFSRQLEGSLLPYIVHPGDNNNSKP
jgi:hypothetical protein